MTSTLRACALALALLAAPAAAQAPASSAAGPATLFERTLPDLLPPGAADADRARLGAEADIAATWNGDPQWLIGVDFDGEAFGGGLARGRYFDFASAGSTIGPDGDVPVEIVFSSEVETLAQAFRFDGGIVAQGVGTFPGAAYDVSDPENPRRLNICFLDGFSGAPDFVWNPNSTSQGGIEWVYVMDSDYDGTGETYADVNFSVTPQDIQYVLWPRLVPGTDILDADPSSIDVDLARIAGLTATTPENGRIDLAWSYDAPDEAVGLRLYTGLDAPDDLLAELDVTETSYTHLVAEPELRRYRLEAVDANGAVVDVSRVVAAQSFISLDATLVGQISPRGNYGDVWGYVDPDTGREYALLAARSSGLSVIDLDGDQLEEVGFVPGITSGGTGGGVADAKDVKTYGSYAYLVHEFAPVQVIDLADPTNPQEVGQIDVQPGVSDGGSHNLLVEGDYLYVVGGRSPGGLRIYDLGADAVNPPLIGEINGVDGQTYYHDLEVVGDLAYAAAIYNQGIDVLDLSDRTNPTVLTTIIYPAGYMGAHNVCATPDGETIFVGDEIGTGTWTRAFDVSDLDDVELIAEIIVDENAVVHNCYVTDDNLLHVAHYTEGYQVFDVTDPAEPERVAFYDTYLEPEYGFSGAWTAYPYLPSRRTLVSNLGEGLFVVSLDNVVVSNESDGAAESFALDAPFPNPTNGLARLRFSLDEASRVRVTLYDVLGRTVDVIAEGTFGAGAHEAEVRTDRLANGVYFVRLDAAGQTATQALTVQR